jgi:hypothetical protein
MSNIKIWYSRLVMSVLNECQTKSAMSKLRIFCLRTVVGLCELDLDIQWI